MDEYETALANGNMTVDLMTRYERALREAVAAARPDFALDIEDEETETDLIFYQRDDDGVWRDANGTPAPDDDQATLAALHAATHQEIIGRRPAREDT